MECDCTMPAAACGYGSRAGSCAAAYPAPG
jgi:hypothetical protein